MHLAPLFAGFLGLATVIAPLRGADSGPAAETTSAIAQAQALSVAYAAIAAQVMPSVVSIQVSEAPARTVTRRPRGRAQPWFDDDLLEQLPPEFRQHFRFRVPQQGDEPGAPDIQQPPRQGQGSGFVIDADGHILTNHHVVDGANTLTVVLADGGTRTATLVGSDPQTDLAVIKVDGSGLTPLRLGSSRPTRVGEWVLAVGSPFGFNQTISSGIVSALGRKTGILGQAGFENFIQTDAAINPGNSGGPLINLQGEVIGINSAIFSRSGGFMGIGFAIPVELAMPIKDQLISSGKVTRGFLGVSIQPLDDGLRQGLNLAGGILVHEVTPGTPAATAGIMPGDVITGLDGQPVTAIDAFRQRVATLAPGSTVTLDVLRDGSQQQLQATLGTYAASDEEVPRTAHGPAQALRPDRYGLGLGSVSDEAAQALGATSAQELPGALITEVDPDSAAAKAGLAPGMVIQQIGSRLIANPRAARDLLDQAKPGERLLIKVREPQGPRYLPLVVPAG